MDDEKVESYGRAATIIKVILAVFLIGGAVMI